MFLRCKSPLKCLFGLQNLDSDWLKRQNRLVKLGSILSSFDKFWSVYLMFCLFYHFFSLFLTLSDWFYRFHWFRRFSDRYMEITTRLGWISRIHGFMENDGFNGFSGNFRWILTYGDLENGLIIASTSYSRDHGLLIMDKITFT